MRKMVQTELKDWPPELQPKEIMFFSVDLVGSTAAKQHPIAPEEGVIMDNSRWFSDIQSFYLQSVSFFLDEFEANGPIKADKNSYAQDIKTPNLWKTQGDEVLFWAEVTDTRQVILYIEAWRSAIVRLKQAMRPANLDFKAAAWIAHFPWRNRMLFSSKVGALDTTRDRRQDTNLQLVQTYFTGLGDEERSSQFGLVPDFVGPGIDIGFRLAAQATHRRLVISTDIAYMIAKGAEQMRRDITGLKMHFEGLYVLKGVLGGLEYPLFWIEMSDEDNDIYGFAHDLNPRSYCGVESIKTFMNSFYHQRDNYLYEPFIVSNTEEILRDVPQWYVDAHKALLVAEKIIAEGA